MRVLARHKMAVTMTGRKGGNVVFIGLSLVILRAAILLGSTVAPPGGECESRFMQDLFTCFNDFHVPFNTYLFVVANGTGGIPADNETVFKEQMCSVEKEVVDCVLDSLHTLAHSDLCHTADGMEALLTGQVRTIFEEYDNYCAHDCRQTLEDDMKQCYTDLGLDPTLFVSNTNDGAILGKSSSSVRDFCKNSIDLITCLQTQTDTCPEASYVMKRLGLDLGTFSTGLQILCRQPEVYLSSLDCFGTQTRSVERCQEEHGLTLRRLLSQTKTQTSITKEALLNNFCLARVQFIKCDLESWAAKPSEACDAPALSLKRDLHCSQLPQACRDVLQGPVEKVCTYNWDAATLTTVKAPVKSLAKENCVPDSVFILSGVVMVLAFPWLDMPP